jgi:hypothetical protein
MVQLSRTFKTDHVVDPGLVQSLNARKGTGTITSSIGGDRSGLDFLIIINLPTPCALQNPSLSSKVVVVGTKGL